MKNSTFSAQVANNLLTLLQGYSKTIRLLLVMFLTFGVGNAWGATYKLTKVTSVSAGEKYVFEQGGYVMNNSVSSSALQCTNTYNTTELAGTETYVWTLESATGGFYMKNVSNTSNQYLNNASSTGVSFGNKSSIWKFTFTDGIAVIQNTSNSSRFLGWTNASSHAYKAYATSNMSSSAYPHDITVYKLEEETSGGGETPDPEPEPGTGGTGTINFNSSAVKIDATSVTGDDNLGNTWTITTVTSSSSFTQQPTYSQVGSSSKPATSITFTTTLPSEGNITAFSAKFGGFSGTAGNVTLKVDDTSVGTGSLNASNDVTVSNSSQATGKKLTVTVTGIAKGVKVYYISYTYTTSSGGGEPETPATDLTDARFAWSAATAEARMGASNTFPTLTNTLSVPVTYESSTPATATIAADGTITLVAPGTTTISAKFAGGEVSGTTYAPKTVTYALTVLKAPATPTSTVYVKVTSTAGITDGEYLIVYEDAEGNPKAPVAFDGSLAPVKLDVASNNIEVSIASNTIAGNTDIDAATFTINTTAGTIQTKDGYYIGQTSNANGLATSTTTKYTNTISIENDGSATIISSGGAYLRYNSDANNWRFRYYKSSSYSAQKAIALYKKASSHTLTYGTCTNGSVSADVADGAKVLSGTTITLSNTPATGYKLTAYDVYKTGDATTKVTVTDGKFIMPEFDVTISATFVPVKTLTSIEITTAATQTTFWQGETFNYTGLVVTARFSGAADEVVTPTVTGSTATAGTQTVTVSYTEGTVTKTATYTIEVKAIPNTKETAYSVADAYDIIDKLTTATGVFITGTISQVDSYNSTYKSITYWISADGTTTKQLEVYSGKGLESADFTAVTDLSVGDQVIVCGNLKKYNSTYEFDKNNYLAEYTPTAKDPAGLAYATTEYTVNLGEEFATPVLTNPNGLTVTYSTSDASKATVDANTGAVTVVAAGTVTITASTIGDATHDAGTASYTITIIDPYENIARLPFTYNSGKADIETTAGITHSGLGSDYADAPYLKFDGTGDYVIIHFDVEPDILSYDIKGNSFSGGTFTVQESENGETYTDIVAYTELAAKETKTHNLASSSRYVKFIYTEKSGGNVALGNISIQKPDLRADAGLVWNPETVTLTVGEAFTPPTLVNPYSVTGISYETSNDAVATVTAEGVIALAGATGKATITATFAGNKDYKQAEVSCTITVNALYTVTLNPNYPEGKTGVFIDTLSSTVSGNLEISLPEGTKSQAITKLYKSIAVEGYIFEGWYEAADGDAHRENTGDISKDITFYAHWKEPYTVTFNAGTGTCTPSSITETKADGIKLPAATLEDCGDWEFAGWAETAIASETPTAPASLLASGSTYKPEGDITLYAVYKRVVGGGGESTTATLTFDNTSKRTTRTTNQQVWTENGITLTNNKSKSTDTVAAYYNPVRFYKSSEIIIEVPENITQIAATTSGGDEYINALKNSVGAEAISSDNVVTITPSTSSNTYTIQLTGGQTRLKSIAVTYGGNASTSYYHSTPNCQVTITYYGFGGGYTTDCETDPVIVITKGDTYQIPNCEPTDYDNTLNRTFAGTWNTKANGKGTAYKPGDEFIVNSDITLYAQWKLETTGNITLPADKEDLATTDIIVTGGTTLTLQAGTTTINSLTLKGGLIGDGKSGNYAMPSVWVPEGAKLVRKNTTINLDLVVNSKSWYPFAVPFAATINANVEYLEPTLAAASEYGTHFAIKTYDGARRAEEGVDQTNNWVQLNRNEKLQPGVGYIISALTYLDKDTATIRIPMSVPNEWLANGELTTVNEVTRNQVAVTAYTGAAATEHQRHAGWNFVANPYLSNFTGGGIDATNGLDYIDGELIIQGSYEYSEETVPYVTIPAYNFAYYSQHKLSDVKLSPEWSFFVQVGTSGTMDFTTTGRQQAPASIAARAEDRPVKMDVDITLSDNHSSDQTGIIISDRYSDAYEIGRDLEKLFGSAYNLSVYTLMADNTPLAFQALAIRSNMQVIPVGYRTPAQGEYTFRLNEATSSIDLLNEQYEQLVLVDYQTGELTNLLIADYTFYSERTQADNRFAIYAVPRQNAPTDLPNAIGQDKQAQKIIHNGHLYILRDGNVYNGNGQIVK